MRVCFWEDRAEWFEPLTLTRPIFDLRLGMTTLRDKILAAVPGDSWGAVVRPRLTDVTRELHPDVPINDENWLQNGSLLVVNSRWLPDGRIGDVSPGVGWVEDEPAYYCLDASWASRLGWHGYPRESPAAHPGAWGFNQTLNDAAATLPRREAGGRWLRFAWDLVDVNGREIVRDFSRGCTGERNSTSGIAVVGSDRDLWVERSAKIDPFVVADTTKGPVILDRGAVVTAFTRLEGPCYIGPDSHVMGAKIRGGTTLGPCCRVGGEVEASILHGFSNKYHEGFLGHSYVGEWVNLGAGTHNSDLRNDYGEVIVTVQGQPVRTGQSKIGCFLGDHTKTGLGTLINTGTNVGVFCNLLPAGRLAPKYVPSFMSWWNGQLSDQFPFDKLLYTAELAMRRRNVVLTAGQIALYQDLLEATSQERRRVLRESLRRSA